MKRAYPLYVMVHDDVRPRRRWILRRGYTGLIHWALETEYNDATSLPWCFEETGQRLIIFFRGTEHFDTPTCVWCASVRVKRVRLRESDIRRYKR